MDEAKNSAGSTRRIRFGNFEADLAIGTLRKAGRPVHLQEQPFRILKFLLERRGEVVTREEIRQKIWGDDVYVDFDRSLNTAVARIREALGDSPHRPAFIETVPRKGYRFINPVEEVAPEDSADASGAISGIRKKQSRIRTALLAMALFAVAIVAAWKAAKSRQSEEPRVVLTASQLTYYRGIENEASFSPDGSQIAFTWNGEGQDNFDVYVKTLEGERPVRLTSDPAREFSPAWSPDGQWIAYARETGDGQAEILRRPPLGGREEKLLEVSWTPYWPESLVASSRLLAWSPDSRNLAVSHRAAGDDTAALYLFHIETGARERLTKPLAPFSDSDPAFSPDGRFLAFRRSKNNNLIGYILPLDAALQPSGPPRQVTPRGAFIAPVWTPAGDRILFSGPLPRPGIWSVDPSDETGLKPIPIAGVRSVLPAVRADGKLVVTHTVGEMNIWRIDLQSSMDQTYELIGSTASDMLPHYSPNGRRIAFLSGRAPRGNWIADADGSNPSRLSDGGIPRWSPDGARIVFDKTESIANRQGDIWLISPSGGPQRQMTHDSANDRVPNWSRDARSIYFASDRSGQDQIWKMPIDGGESQARQLTTDGGFLATESLDGETLYYSKFEEQGLWRLPLAGGPEEKFIDAAIDWANYAVAGEGIYYAVNVPSTRGGSIYFYRFADATTSEVFSVPKRIGVGLDVSPDGRYLLYTQFDREESDLMLVDNFR